MLINYIKTLTYVFILLLDKYLRFKILSKEQQETWKI